MILNLWTDKCLSLRSLSIEILQTYNETNQLSYLLLGGGCFHRPFSLCCFFQYSQDLVLGGFKRRDVEVPVTGLLGVL